MTQLTEAGSIATITYSSKQSVTQQNKYVLRKDLKNLKEAIK